VQRGLKVIMYKSANRPILISAAETRADNTEQRILGRSKMKKYINNQ
jgi:hypothetical protein